MPKFVAKVVIIEAEQLRPDNIGTLEVWCGGQIKGSNLHISERCIDIQTLEGEMRANMSDWIIKELEGEFYPCKNSVFIKKYERITDA